MIKVRFFGPLAKLMPETNEDGFWILEEDNITIAEVLEKTSIKEENVKYTTMVDNMRKPADYCLHHGDTLLIMPLLAGG